MLSSRTRSRIARAAVAAAVLAGLLLPGSAAARPADDEGGAAAAAAGDDQGQGQDLDGPSQPRPGWLQISAFTDAPVVGADVRVRTVIGRVLVDQPAATNDQGVFPAPVPGRPSSFRVTVSGGTTGGTLSADFRNFDSTTQIAAVDPATTLVSKVLDRRPLLGLAGAQARVRGFLGLPDNSSLGLALRDGETYQSPYFDEAAFMAEARQHGGLDAFENALVRELLASPTATHPFPGSPHPDTVAAPAALLAKKLAGSALTFAGGQGFGWVLEASGLSQPGVSPQDIAALQRGLFDLQSSVDQLNTQQEALLRLIKAAADRGRYDTVVVPALGLAARVNGLASDLAFFAEACPPLPESAAAQPMSEFCTNQKASLRGALNDLVFSTQAYDQLSRWVLDNPTHDFSGTLHLYSLWLGESRPFFRAADSTKIRNLFDYWDAVLVQAANLRVELLHLNANGDPRVRPQLIEFLGDPTANPPTKGTLQLTHDQALKLVKPAVPEGTVINTRDQKMWALASPDEVACTVSSVPWNTEPDSLMPKQPYWSLPKLAGLDGWYLPGYSDWLNLVAGARASGANWMSWLIEQTQAKAPEAPVSAGWFDHATACGVGAWSSTGETGTAPETTCSGRRPDIEPCRYWVAHEDKNAFSLEMPEGRWNRRPPHNVKVPVRSLAPGEEYYFTS